MVYAWAYHIMSVLQFVEGHMTMGAMIRQTVKNFVLTGLVQNQLPILSTPGPQAKRWQLGHHHIPHFEEKVASGDHMVGVRSGIGNVEYVPH